MKENLRRVTVTLPPDLVDGLDKLAGLTGVSRSSLVAGLLSEAVGYLSTVVGALENPTTEGLARFRGESIAHINDKVSELRALLDGGDDLLKGAYRNDEGSH